VKVGIVGAGFVGATAAYAIALRGAATELVLVDANHAKAVAEAEDVAHATPFTARVRVLAGGYEDLAGSQVVVLAAGANQRPGETRQDLLRRNAEILHQVLPQVDAAAPAALQLVATNPVDAMTLLAERYAADAGLPPGRVLGTGTMLDTARFRAAVARHVGVDAQHAHGYVVGEHGDSEVLAWSALDVGGRPVDEVCHALGVPWGPDQRARIEDEVVRAAYRIIEGKGATYFGVGAAIARAIEVVLRDQRAILTVSASDPVSGCALSLPRIVSGDGVGRSIGIALDEDEHARLEASASVLRAQAAELT
jgi:L-lactate dehydrogenase